MIKIRVNENKCCEVECAGSFFDIAAELSYAINEIYHGIKASSHPHLAESFRRVISCSVGNSESPVWTHTPNRTAAQGVVIISEKQHGG